MAASNAPSYRAMLSHDWKGRDGKNHDRVTRVFASLKRIGLECWFDEVYMKGDVTMTMIEAVEQSEGFLAFVTRRYHDKVAGVCEDDGYCQENDNCWIEFSVAQKHMSCKRMLAVVLEDDMLDHKQWKGLMKLLAGRMYVRLTNIDSMTDAQLDAWARSELAPQMSWLEGAGKAAVISREVDSFLVEEVELEEDVLEKFKELGVTRFKDLSDIEEEDLVKKGVPLPQARRFIRKRPQSSRPPPVPAPPNPEPREQSNGAPNAEAEALALLERGGATLAQVQAALRTHLGSARVAEKACEKVRIMCFHNDNNRAEAGRLGLLADLQAALRGHRASADVTEQACRAVNNMCVNANNRAEAGRLGLLADLQAALRGHRASAGVTEQACAAVDTMCFNDNNNRADAGRLGLLADLQAALRDHRASADVTENACGAVNNMCFFNDNNKAEAGRLGLLADLQAALSSHKGTETGRQAQGAINSLN